MTILTLRSTQIPPALCLVLRLLVFCVCAIMPVASHAQTEKQISYPVAVPVVRTVTSAASAPVQRAPTPVIRSLDSAATPPVRTKAPTKSATITAPKVKSTKTLPAKAPVTAATKPPSTAKVSKTSSTKASTGTSKTKQASAKKATAKPTTVKKAVAHKPTAPKTTAAKTKAVKPTAKASLAPKSYPEPISAPSKTSTNRLATYPEPEYQAPPPHKPLNSLAAPIAMGAVAAVGVSAANAGISVEEEQALALSLSEEGDYLVDPDTSAELTSPTPTTPAVAPVQARTATVSAAPLANTVLPMSNQREGFVTAFKNFVETTIVPKTPGIALAIIADGKVKVLQTYGVKKVGTNSLVNADTTFRLASVSKSFGATAAAMMVNDGLIRWDSKVTSLLPKVEFSNPRYGDQLTVQHILSQSTGLPTQANSNFIEEGLSFDEVVRRLRYVNFVCPPGKCYNYQNVTFSLIDDIVLKETGMSYEQYLENKIFRPLGMRTATVGFAGYSLNGNYAVPHVPTRKGWAATTVTEHYYRVNPAAGVNASITDMSRWVLAHMGQNPNVLSPAVLNAVHSKITRNTPAQNHYGSREGVTDSHYGLGWRVFDYRGDKNFIHHGGGVKGFRSEVVFNPELKIGMVILTNGPRLSGSVIFEFLDAYEDEKRGERRPEAVAPVKKKKK